MVLPLKRATCSPRASTVPSTAAIAGVAPSSAICPSRRLWAGTGFFKASAFRCCSAMRSCRDPYRCRCPSAHGRRSPAQVAKIHAGRLRYARSPQPWKHNRARTRGRSTCETFSGSSGLKPMACSKRIAMPDLPPSLSRNGYKALSECVDGVWPTGLLPRPRPIWPLAESKCRRG
jgi:hypothetical protein